MSRRGGPAGCGSQQLALPGSSQQGLSLRWGTADSGGPDVTYRPRPKRPTALQGPHAAPDSGTLQRPGPEALARRDGGETRDVEGAPTGRPRGASQRVTWTVVSQPASCAGTLPTRAVPLRGRRPRSLMDAGRQDPARRRAMWPLRPCVRPGAGLRSRLALGSHFPIPTLPLPPLQTTWLAFSPGS